MFVAGYIFGSLSTSGVTIETYFTPSNLEKSLQQNFGTYFVIVIFSSPKNFERRQVIRKTWILLKGNSNIKHYFAIGANSLDNEQLFFLKEEHKSYEDLLLLYSFRDSYARLSEKLLEVFTWIDGNIQYKFLLKVDDDSFVQIEALSKALTKLPPKRLYWGFFDGQASVKTRGKWKEKNWFLCDRYLPYAKGGGYVVSQDLVHITVSVSNYLTLYQNEDVSLGTWLAPFNIKRVHEPNFDTEFQSRGCLNSYLITHKQTTSMMEQKYKSLRDSGHICLSEHKVRNSYVYNWNVPPSQCCSRNENVP